MWQIRIIVLGAALALLLSPRAVSARIWQVAADGSGDAPTIQAGMDSALAGDDVVLAPGTYTWTAHAPSPDTLAMVFMKSGVTLRSEAGASTTILDGENVGRIVLCADVGEVRIEGLTLQRGYGPVRSNDLAGGGGICAFGSSRPAIANCVIRNNSGFRGAGIQINGGGAITNCEILDNRGGTSGGGIYGHDLVVSHCRIVGNSTGGEGSGGGGLTIIGGSVVDCHFESNWANGVFGAGGGAIQIWEQRVEIRRSTFLSNKVLAVIGNGIGAAINVRSGDCLVSECIFVNNQIRVGDGSVGFGVLAAERAGLDVTGCTIIGNSTEGTSSTVGIELGPTSRGTVASTIIAWNRGGLPCRGSSLQFSCSNLYGNSGGDTLCGTDLGGNFSADPQFCGVDPAASLNLSLQQDSPCAPGNHPAGSACGLIGARPIGCEAVAIEQSTWGKVKTLYRR